MRTVRNRPTRGYFNSGDVSITLYGLDGVSVIASTTAFATNEGAFFGVMSPEAIGHISIGSLSNPAEGVDNISFGAAFNCIPE